MSSYLTTKAAIKAAIEYADATATVHDRKRIPHPPTDDKLAELLIETKADGTKQVHAWMFTRINSPSAAMIAEPGTASIREITETWKIFGYRSFDDAGSEYDFQQTIDEVRSALATHSAFTDLRKRTAYVQDISIATIDEALLTNQHLCHWCEIFLTLVYPTTLL